MIKLRKLLCLIDLTKTDDKASLFVDQVVENDDDFRLGLTPFEQSRALFMAHQLGATRTEIGKRTGRTREEDRKSTRLNSSHVKISYAVFCLKKKTPHDT